MEKIILASKKNPGEGSFRDYKGRLAMILLYSLMEE